MRLFTCCAVQCLLAVTEIPIDSIPLAGTVSMIIGLQMGEQFFNYDYFFLSYETEHHLRKATTTILPSFLSQYLAHAVLYGEFWDPFSPASTFPHPTSSVTEIYVGSLMVTVKYWITEECLPVIISFVVLHLFNFQPLADKGWVYGNCCKVVCLVLQNLWDHLSFEARF